MSDLTADDLRTLASGALPALFFSDKEEFFPGRAESWLTHTTTAPWDTMADPDDIGALATDGRHRGTCLVRSGDEVTEHVHVAGPPNASDRSLRLESSGAEDAIGNPAYAQKPIADAELFLSFAGWNSAAEPHKGGDLGYLRAAFSELASAINHDVPWEVLATRSNRPYFGVPQPVSPAVYCEIDWAGAHFREAPPAEGIVATALDSFLQVTYFYLFPARVALAGQPDVAPLEGQWAAVSLFYPARANSKTLDERYRPESIDLRGNRPEWVVLSLDPENRSCIVLRVGQDAIQVIGDPATMQANARVWVGAGSHRFFPGQSGEVPTGSGEPWPNLDYEPGSDMEGIFPAVFPGMMGNAIGEAGGVLNTIFSGGWVWWFIAWLINLFTELWDDDASTVDIPQSGDSPIDPGPQVGNPNFGPSAPSDPTQPAPDGWPTNEGSVDGWDVAYFDLMVCTPLKAIAEGAPDLEPPPWWSYTGRWGIKVPPESTWVSGTRRTDERGRSWAYWMATSLFNRMVNEAPVPPGP